MSFFARQLPECELEVSDLMSEPPLSERGSGRFQHRLVLGERWGAKYSIISYRDRQRMAAVLVVAAGHSEVGAHCLVASPGRCFCAVGRFVICLSLPDLTPQWELSVDPASILGLYADPTSNDLLVHGELEIARLSQDGELRWSASGPDVFTGPFELTDDAVIATDYSGQRHMFAISSGAPLLDLTTDVD